MTSPRTEALPVRVLANGDGAQVTFTVFGRAGGSVGELQRDSDAGRGHP